MNNTLRISSLNIRRGLYSKEEELFHLIKEQSCDVCSFSEVDIVDFDEKKPFSIEGFKTFFPLKRTGTNTKRLICLVKVGIEAKQRDDLMSEHTTLFYKFFSAHMSRKSKSLLAMMYFQIHGFV